MKKYICKSNFVTGEKGSYVHHKKGEAFSCDDEEIAAELLAEGMIADKNEITIEELEDLEKKIKAAREELAALQEKSKILQRKLQNQEPSDEESDPNGEPEIDEELLDEVDEELEGEESVEGDEPAHAPKKKKKKKNR